MADEYCRKCKARLTTCPTCKGKGTTMQGSAFWGYSEKPCPNCKGSGKICPRHGHDWG
jgi:DnaJ-class molecular chaperone